MSDPVQDIITALEEAIASEKASEHTGRDDYDNGYNRGYIKGLRFALQEVRSRGRSKLEVFVRSLLNPEENGLAVPAHVRDDAREALGMKRVEY